LNSRNEKADKHFEDSNIYPGGQWLSAFFLADLEFEFRASHFLGKHSTTWLHTSPFFTLVCFSNRVSHFPQTSLYCDCLISASWVAGISGVYHHACLPPPIFLDKKGLPNFSDQDGHDRVAWITDMHYHTPMTVLSQQNPASPIPR
jgi:hypothetical protein